MGRLYTNGTPITTVYAVNSNAPFDTRLTVRYIADLTDGENGGIAENVYKGMVVYVQENNSLYVYIGSSSSTWKNKKTGAPMNGGLESNWVKIDSFLDPSVDLQYYAERIGARIFETEDELTGTIDSPYRGMFAMVIGDSDDTTVEATGLYILLDDDNTNPDNWLRIDPDFSNFVTKDDLADYLSSSDLEGYVKFEDIADFVSQDDLADLASKADLDGFIKIEDLPDYLTESDLDPYLKVSELPVNVSAFINDAGYLTEHQDLSGYVKVEDLVDYLTASDLDDYAKKSDIPVVPTKVSDLVNDRGFLTDSDLTEYVKLEDIIDFVSHDDIADLASKADLDGFIKMEDLPDYLTESDLDPYLKVSELPTNVSAFINDAEYIRLSDLPDFLTASDLDGYVKVEDLAPYLKAEDIADLAKKSDLDGYVKLEDAVDFLTSSDLDDYAKKSDLEDYLKSEDLPINVSDFINDAGYLTEHQDLSDYATKSELPTEGLFPVESEDGVEGYATVSGVIEYVDGIQPESISTQQILDLFQ